MKINNRYKKKLKSFLLNKIKDLDSNKIVIITPYLLDDDTVEKIKKIFPQYSNYSYTQQIDPSIIGGFILKDGSTYIDASIQGKINELTNVSILN